MSPAFSSESDFRSPVKPIIGSAAMCNVSFGYVVIALASTYQLVTVDLDFHVEDPEPKQVPAQPASAVQIEHDPASLLLAYPFSYDETIAAATGGATDYRKMARGVSVSPMNTFSAGQLRAIGDIISNIQARIGAVRAASQALESHLDLCVKEFQRQMKMIQASYDGLEQLRDTKIPVRTLQLLDKQSDLAKRLDKLLSGLVKHYGPKAGEAERQWLRELEELKAKIQGEGGWWANYEWVSRTCG